MLSAFPLEMWERPEFLQLVEMALNGDKLLVFVAEPRNIIMLGAWQECEGVFVSNRGHELVYARSWGNACWSCGRQAPKLIWSELGGWLCEECLEELELDYEFYYKLDEA